MARLPALIAGLAFCVVTSFAVADSLPEVQRLMKQGQMPQALEKVDALIASKPKDAQSRFLKGLILTEMSRPADAIAVFTKLTEDFPELPEPYNNLAVLYAQQKQYDKARTALEMAIRTHPSYSIAHENLGDVYAKLASQAYDKALQLDSGNAVAQTKLSLIRDLISTSTAKPGSKTATPAKASEATPIAAPVKLTATEKPVAATPPKPAEAKPVEVATSKPADTKPLESKATETKPAATPSGSAPTAKASTDDEGELNRTLKAWANAWSHKDVKGYLSFYANDFQTPNGMPRQAWEAERKQRIEKPGAIQVNVESIHVSLSGNKATLKFRQHYKSASLKSSTDKTVIFIKSGDKWLIQQERVG